MTTPRAAGAARLRLIGYLRVSTDRQAEHGLGLSVQRAAITKWAKAEGYRITAWQADEGISGSNGLEGRAGLAGALHAIRAGQADGLVVYRLDRLARDLVLQEQLLAEVRRQGGQVHTTSAAEAGYLADDPGDPSRRLIRQVLGAVNEYERAMIALRMRSGREAKAARGGYAYGAPAYGYRAEAKELVADPAEAEAVALILELSEAGKSTRAIVAELDARGIKAKRGDGWHSETVRRIIVRERGKA